MSGSEDTIYYGTAECSDDAEADEDDRCNQLRKENKAKYHPPLHNQAFRALSTWIRKPQSIGLKQSMTQMFAQAAGLIEGNGMCVSKERVCSCKTAAAVVLCQTGTLGT